VFRAPAPVRAYHVPICTVQLESLMDMNWDMTLQKVVPRRIWLISDYPVYRRPQVGQENLASSGRRLYAHKTMHGAFTVGLSAFKADYRSYGCLSLVDIFQFNNVYALTPDIEDIVASPDLQEECVRYVTTGNTSCPGWRSQ
jgi:hypothetical protein